MLRPVLVYLIAIFAQGCAVGAGAGINLTVDTRGTVGIMATLSADPYAARVESKKTPKFEESVSILPFAVAVSGGIQLNPGAGVLRLDAPGIGYTWNKIHGGEGAMGSVSGRFDLKWPFSGGYGWAVGGVVKGGWMSHLKVKQHPRVAARPEWPDGWDIHQIGPLGEVAVMYDERGVFAQFGVGFKYHWVNYYYFGL